MTQPQYGYPPQQGGYQPDPYAQQGYQQQGPPLTYQQPPAPQYYPAPNQAQPQSYSMQPVPPLYPGQPQQPPAPQGARGTLDDFYGQPSTGGGKGISWKQKPDMYRYVGVVAKTPQDADVFQDSDPQTKQLKFWRDGNPKMVLPVQLRLAFLDAWQAQEYREGDASVFLRGAMKEEVSRAMGEAGVAGVPQQGALMDITLTHRKPGNNIASNVYAVVYRPAGTWETDPAYAWVAQALQQPAQAMATPPQQAPYQQQASAQYAAPAQAYPNPQQYAQAPAGYAGQPQAAPQYGQQAYDPNPQSAPVLSTASGQPVVYQQQIPNPQAPVNQAPAPSQPAGQPQQFTGGGVLPPGATQVGQVQGQQQLPIPGVNGPVPQQGVTPSQLDPNQQQLLARISGGQIQPQQVVQQG